jgi:formylglycine-generating enzyme required for sulfatase activity
MMGSPWSEVGREAGENQHSVTLSKGFWLGETEVTQGQWRKIMDNETVADLARKGLYDDTPCCYKDRKMVTLREFWEMDYNSDPVNRCGDFNDNVPVYNLNWYEAVEFCKRLTRREQAAGRVPDGYEYRLPTEAEWEYACRAGTSTALPNGLEMRVLGDNNAPALDNIAWYGGNASVGFDGRGVDVSEWKDMQYAGGRAFSRGVKGKAANNWGFYDMIGNVYEWCYDLRREYSGDVADPIGASSGVCRVLRGGSWSTQARYCRSAYRPRENPHYRAYYIGFRVALAPSHPGMTYPEAPVVAVPRAAEMAANKLRATVAFNAKRYDEAYRMFMKSDLGDKVVQWFLGNMYAEGYSVDRNESEAVKLYRKSAEQDFAIAQRSLGIMYECGRGVARNIEEAKKWYRKAAAKGDIYAKQALDRLEPQVVPVAPAAISQNRKNQELIDRPYDLQFCRHCRMRLSHLKQVPKNCPQCGRNLFGR